MKRVIKTLSIILLCVMSVGLVMRLVELNHTPDPPSSVVENDESSVCREIENGGEYNPTGDYNSCWFW